MKPPAPVRKYGSDVPTDSLPLAEPIRAELLDELTERVAGAPQRLTSGGWAALSRAGELLVLDDHLRVVGRFRVPERIVPELEHYREPPRYRLDISPDGRLAVFPLCQGRVGHAVAREI